MKLFLSHSTKDKAFVEKLAAALRAHNIDPWWCEVDIDHGADFVAKIDEGLNQSDLILLVLSPEAAQSAWTRKEWTAALAREVEEKRTRLGVLLLRDCDVPELLRTKHRFDARTDPNRAIGEVMEWAKRMRDQRKLADTKAPRTFLAYEPKDFIGRERYLAHLQTALVDQPGVYLLHGEPGSGKSTLALKFAWKAQPAFDAVVFQTCGQRSAEEIAVELAGRLKLENMRAAPPEVQLEAAHNWLRERLSLLVLDDVWNDDTAKLLPGPPVSVLVTSRRRNWPWVESSSRELVESFSPDEAEACFRTYLGEAAVAHYRTALMAFAERMERLPLAITVAAAMLSDSADPVEEAAVNLRLADLQSVSDLLQKAIDRKPEADHRLLQAAAVCSPDGFWLPLAGQIASLGDADLRAARDRLVNSSLLRVVDRDRRRFQLHALLREQVRVSAPITDLEERHAAALEGIFEEWETRWRDCRECLDEVIPAMEQLWRTGGSARMRLSYCAFAVGRRIGDLEGALRILLRRDSFWAGRDDNEAKDSMLRSYGNQALILRDWGRLEEAMALHRKVEALCVELGDEYALQISYGNQGLILMDWGREEEAMALHKKQEALCLELGDKRGLSASYASQAGILQAWRRLEEALGLLKKSEALCRDLGDKNVLQRTCGSQAVVLMDLGRLEEAMALLQQSEAVWLELGNRSELQRSHHNQALILLAWGRPDEAMVLFKKQQALCLELGLPRDLGICYWNWGLLARAQRDHATERAKLQAALSIFTELKMTRERDAVAAELAKSDPE
ncbi:MAG: TIR domain-containing protein [Bryobacteraceae bacterium]|jgi:tetratricopeptide (TPR) repeat protein